MDDKDELRRRRQAIRLWLKGVAPSQILQRVQRGRTWFNKWRDRFERLGPRGLGSQSRQPRHRPAAHSPQMVRWIVRTRQRLERERVGLIGPRAIRRELRALRLGRRLPSLATIKRVLKAEGLTTSPPAETHAYRPLPLTQLPGCLQAMDWTCRYTAPAGGAGAWKAAPKSMPSTHSISTRALVPKPSRPTRPRPPSATMPYRPGKALEFRRFCSSTTMLRSTVATRSHVSLDNLCAWRSTSASN